MRRGQLQCPGASAAILAPTARTWVRPVPVSAGGVQLASGAEWQGRPRTPPAKSAHQALGVALWVLRVSPRASTAQEARGAVPSGRALRAPVQLAVQGSTSQRWARPPRITASHASLAATTVGLVWQGARDAPRVPGAALVVRHRAMSAQMVLGPTSRGRSMLTIALVAREETTARQGPPPAW